MFSDLNGKLTHMGHAPPFFEKLIALCLFTPMPNLNAALNDVVVWRLKLEFVRLDGCRAWDGMLPLARQRGVQQP